MLRRLPLERLRFYGLLAFSFTFGSSLATLGISPLSSVTFRLAELRRGKLNSGRRVIRGQLHKVCAALEKLLGHEGPMFVCLVLETPRCVAFNLTTLLCLLEGIRSVPEVAEDYADAGFDLSIVDTCHTPDHSPTSALVKPRVRRRRLEKHSAVGLFNPIVKGLDIVLLR